MTMLFTVNVETINPPASVLLDKIEPGFGVKTAAFDVTKQELNYENNFPIESETGFEVIPGKIELRMLMTMIDRCINYIDVSEVVTLGYKNFRWPGHVMASKPIYLQYTVSRCVPRLGCTDVDWLCQLMDTDHKVACEITIKHRIYS